jgi:20S proteasome alpha/beta subunit
MSYIAAFRFRDGVVMCADTQETVSEDHKQYSEKVFVNEDAGYPLAVGGAGVDEVCEAFAQELLSRVAAEGPRRIIDLIRVAKEAIADVYAKDLTVAVIPRQLRTAEFLIAARTPEDGFAILRLRGRRVFSVASWAIIGYATAVNRIFMERLYRADLPVGQAVLVAVHLVSQSKRLDQGVGGETTVAVVQAQAAWREPSRYLKHDEVRTQEFMRLTDDLFLSSTDTELSTADLKVRLDTFTAKALELHRAYIRDVTATMLSHGINLANEPRSRIPLGSLVTGGGGIRVYEPGQLDAAAIRRLQQSEASKEGQQGDGPVAAPTPKDAPGSVDQPVEVPSKTSGHTAVED